MGEDGRAMSLQITRPTSGTARREEAVAGRPLAIGAAFAGASAAVIGLVVCMSVALTGWFLADAGAHGDTTDALRVGADAWLMGHGADLVLSGVPLGMPPLAVTMVLVMTVFRSGRWAAVRTAAPSTGADGALAGAVATFTCAYLVVATVTCVLASQAGASPALGQALLGGLLVGAVGGGLGLAVGTGRFAAWLERTPVWLGHVVFGGLAGALALVAAGAVLVAAALLLSFNEAATVLSGLHLSVGDALTYTVVVALFAPNTVLFGAAYLLGPGFAVGTGTTVSATAVSLGVVPAYPVLAALPDEGPTPGWLAVLIAVPVLAAAVGIGLTMRRHEPIDHDLAALRGAGGGFVAGIVVTLLISVAGGPLGTGRMADIGAPVSEVLVFATGLMSAGGMLGALAQNWWRRRGGHSGRIREGEDTELTVEVLR
jgi:hypothetical protein